MKHINEIITLRDDLHLKVVISIISASSWVSYGTFSTSGYLQNIKEIFWWLPLTCLSSMWVDCRKQEVFTISAIFTSINDSRSIYVLAELCYSCRFLFYCNQCCHLFFLKQFNCVYLSVPQWPDYRNPYTYSYAVTKLYALYFNGEILDLNSTTNVQI